MPPPPQHVNTLFPDISLRYPSFPRIRVFAPSSFGVLRGMCDVSIPKSELELAAADGSALRWRGTAAARASTQIRCTWLRSCEKARAVALASKPPQGGASGMVPGRWGQGRGKRLSLTAPPSSPHPPGHSSVADTCVTGEIGGGGGGGGAVCAYGCVSRTGKFLTILHVVSGGASLAAAAAASPQPQP
jgi:hypothetical protein